MRRRPARNGQHAHVELLSHYGVDVGALNDVHHDHELRLAASWVKPPRETAKTMVFYHPEIGSTNGVVAPDVLDNYITQAEGFGDLVRYIQDNPPGSED